MLENWQRDYGGNLLIMLPDTFTTAASCATRPDWLARWTGVRIDSGDPVAGGEMVIDWWRARGEDPAGKLMIFSDGLDVETMRCCTAASPDG